MTKWSEIEYKNYLDIDKYEVKDLPLGIKISTICASCRLNTKIYTENIEKYLQLNADDVLSVYLNKDNKEKYRTLIISKVKPKRVRNVTIKPKEVKKKGNHFYNCITVVMRVNEGPIDDLGNASKINMKIFKNGSIQMSGCKSIQSINTVLNKLIIKLKEVKGKMENGVIDKITFIEDENKIIPSNFKIDMINSNYKVNMQFDRDKLYNLLLKKKIKSAYELCIRACVIIKYIPEVDNDESKVVSIFVFQKGNIIITGARSRSHVIAAYEFINQIILTHNDEIIKKDEKQEEDLILELYDTIMEEVKVGLITL